jgi:hypothetical protein
LVGCLLSYTRLPSVFLVLPVPDHPIHIDIQSNLVIPDLAIPDYIHFPPYAENSAKLSRDNM